MATVVLFWISVAAAVPFLSSSATVITLLVALFGATGNMFIHLIGVLVVVLQVTDQASGQTNCAICFNSEPMCSEQCSSCTVIPTTCKDCASAVCLDDQRCPPMDCGDGCQPLERDGTCQCGAGRECPPGVCQGASCPGDPDAVCSVDSCGSCQPVWTASTGSQANCTSMVSTCQDTSECSSGEVCSNCSTTEGICTTALAHGETCDPSCSECGMDLSCQVLTFFGTNSSRCCPSTGSCPPCPAGQQFKRANGCPTCECEPLPCGVPAGDQPLASCSDDPCTDETFYCDGLHQVCCRYKSSECAAPVDSGLCSESITRYAFSVELNRCEPFTYSGCGGNENRFDTLEQCQNACHTACPVLDCGLCELLVTGTDSTSCPVCSETECSTTTVPTSTTTVTVQSTTSAASDNPVYTRLDILLSGVIQDVDFTEAVQASLQAVIDGLTSEPVSVKAADSAARAIAISNATAAPAVRAQLQQHVQDGSLSQNLRTAGVAQGARLISVPQTTVTRPSSEPVSIPRPASDDGVGDGIIALIVIVALLLFLALLFLIWTCRNRKSVDLTILAEAQDMLPPTRDRGRYRGSSTRV